MEFNLDPVQGRNEGLFLNRLRLNATVEPARWAKLVFQGQDARAFDLHGWMRTRGLRDTLDVRLGYIELGHSEQGWQARFGRQELPVGDERLIGADNYWDPFGQSFDAVRLAWFRTGFRFEAFTGFRVEPAPRPPDPYDTASRISGLCAQWKSGVHEGLVEPYLLWKRGEDSQDLAEHRGHRDTVTPGLRLQGGLPGRLDYRIEMAVQRGHVVDEPISAWAGHWEMGWKLPGSDPGPRVRFEFNFASGDADAQDGRHQTFDDLFPAGFNGYGIADPFAWRNIQYPAAAVEVPLSRRATLYGGFRAYWVATAGDGVYASGDTFLIRNPTATSSHIGDHFFLSVTYFRSVHWRMDAGYGYLLPGGYLRQAGYMAGLQTVYVLSSFTL